MTFDEALKRYTDEDGLILERPNMSDGPETGNGIHGLCLANLIRYKRGELKREHVWDFIRIIESCEVRPKPWLPSIAGLYHRGPRKTGELIAHDDYRMLSAVSSLIGAPFAREIVQHGNVGTLGWSFNNLEPFKWTLRTWHRRFPGVVPLYKICGGMAPWPHEIEGLKSVLWFAPCSDNAGSWILNFAAVEALRGRLAEVDLVIERWDTQLKSKWGSLAALMAAYYGPQHPFSCYLE